MAMTTITTTTQLSPLSPPCHPENTMIRNGLVLPRTVAITRTRMGVIEPCGCIVVGFNPLDFESSMNSADGTAAAISGDA